MASKGKDAAVEKQARTYSCALEDVTPTALEKIKVGMVVVASEVVRFKEMGRVLGFTSTSKAARNNARARHPCLVLAVDKAKGEIIVIQSTSAKPNKKTGKLGDLNDTNIKKEYQKYFISVASGNPVGGQPKYRLVPEEGENSAEGWFITYATAHLKPDLKGEYAVVNEYTFLQKDVDFLNEQIGTLQTEANNFVLDSKASQRKQ